MRNLLLLFGLAIAVAACTLSEDIDGPVESVTRDLAPFSRIDLRGVGDATIVNGTSDYIEITTHSDLFNNILTHVTDGELVIDLQGAVRNVEILKYVVHTSTRLSDISLSGVGDLEYNKPAVGGTLRVIQDGVGNITLSGIDAQRVIAQLEDVGDIDLFGASHAIEFGLSGVGSINGFELYAQMGEVNLSGVGDIEVYVTDTLTIHHDGVGKVRYKADPYLIIGTDDDIVGVD